VVNKVEEVCLFCSILFNNLFVSSSFSLYDFLIYRIDKFNTFYLFKIQMHGRKKRGTQITEEELKKKQEQATKIGQMVSDFLAFRKDTSKITDPLEYTAVMVKICPEINTIYNLRREVIENMIGSLPPKDKYNFLLKELKLLLPLMQSNPKSYCLWHHRYIYLISI
jgi:hypothetical protein